MHKHKPYVIVVNSTDAKIKARIPVSSSNRLLTPKAATATTKENDAFVLEVSPHGCAVLAR